MCLRLRQLLHFSELVPVTLGVAYVGRTMKHRRVALLGTSFLLVATACDVENVDDRGSDELTAEQQEALDEALARDGELEAPEITQDDEIRLTEIGEELASLSGDDPADVEDALSLIAEANAILGIRDRPDEFAHARAPATGNAFCTSAESFALGAQLWAYTSKSYAQISWQSYGGTRSAECYLAAALTEWTARLAHAQAVDAASSWGARSTAISYLTDMIDQSGDAIIECGIADWYNDNYFSERAYSWQLQVKERALSARTQMTQCVPG